MAAMDGVWSPERRALTLGLIGTITLVAFESMAVTTIMPDVKDDLGGVGLYGWVFSAFFLGNLVGVVVAGQLTDHRGPATAYLLGLSLFVVGLLVGGLAPTMLVLVLGRAVQGFGAGAVPATAYASIGRAYPEAIRPRVFAIMSTAWVVPGLVGPGIASVVSTTVGWRWVFLGLVPMAAVLGTIAHRSLRPLAIVDGDRPDSRLVGALRIAGGATLVLAGLTSESLLAALPLVATGVVVGFPAFRRLVPAGTLRAAPGLPAAVAARGILTFAFFGTDAYITLAVTDARGGSTLLGGAALTATALTWASGSWLQERMVNRVGTRRFVTVGHVVVLAGIAMAAVTLWDRVPLGTIVVAWAIAGLGMGMSYAPISLAVLRESPPGQEGASSSSMQLSDVLGVSLGTGLGGAAIALGDGLGWDAATGIGLAWLLAGSMAALGIAVARRLPGPETPALAAAQGDRPVASDA